MERYIVVPPVEGGYRWWKVADRQSEVMPNFEVAMFSADYVIDAEGAARRLCDLLNGR